MNFNHQAVNAKGIRISVTEDGMEMGRAYLYVMQNDLHDRPFGLMEDVYVNESCRGKGIGSKLVQQVIATAQDQKCYKLIATSRASRPKVHELYQKIGFTLHGVEFRIDFE